MTMFSRTLGLLAAVTVFAAVARADTAAVNKYLDDATELVGKGSQFFADATAKLELAEASMDDVPDAEKPALKAKIDAIKAQIQSSAGAEDKARIERDVKGLIEQLEGLVGNLVVWPGKSAELTELLNDPKTAAALGEPAVTAYKKQFATMQKVHAGRAFKENFANAKQQVEELEKTWADTKAKVEASDASDQQRQSALTDTERALEQIKRYLKDLPTDNAEVKQQLARVETVRTAYTAAVGASDAREQVAKIDGYLESNKEEFAGMEAETTPPTWADYKANTGQAREFNAPKTREFVRRVSSWLPEFEKSEDYIAAKDASTVKAKMDEVNAKLAAAREKLKKHAEALVAGLEAEKVTKANEGEAGSLSDQLRNALGQDSPDGKALMARVDKAMADFKNAGDKAEADTLAYYKSMTEQAEKAWPAMAAKFDVSDGFDPNNASALKGKYIKLVGNNLMGWRFKHGDFPYATKVNGIAVAGKYDPAVKAALAEVEGKLGRAIGDNDADGEWTAIATVDGGTGRLVELVNQSGDVTVDGTKVGTVEGRVERPTDAPIVTIVALKAGPVAVAQGQGAVNADGSVAAPTGAAATGGRHGFSFIGLISGLLAVVVGAACLMKAKFAPLAGNAGAVQMVNKVGSDNLAYAGLASIVLGTLGALMFLVQLPHAFVHALLGLLASLAMIVAGGVVSRDFLESRGLLPAAVAGPLTQFAIPAGLACTALGLLTVVTSIF